MSMFFWQILYILHFENNNMMLHFFAYHDSAYCSWKDLFALDAYSAYLQYMADTGRSKMRQEFWSFRGFRTEQIGLECPSGFSHSIPHDNEMLIKQDGNLRKRHYTHIYMRCIYYIYVHACTCILDVSKRSVLGSADAYSVIFSDHVLFC